MNPRTTLLALAIGAGLLSLSACKKDASSDATTGDSAASAKKDADADAFVARIKENLLVLLG